MDKYWYIYCSEDGETYVHEFTKEELEEALNNEYFGTSITYFDGLPANDTSYWGNGTLLIKGKVIQPQAVKVATKYDLP